MSENERQGDVNPTARWLVHGAWKVALATVVILLVAGIVTAIAR
jgi:hypothetical protein